MKVIAGTQIQTDGFIGLRFFSCTAFVFLFFFFQLLFPFSSFGWQTISEGLEYGSFEMNLKRPVGDSKITILRINPRLWQLVVVGKSWGKEKSNLSVKDWADRYKFTAAINCGMFGKDYATHIGYLGSYGHVNNSHVNKYKSVAAFDPKKSLHPPFQIFDLDNSQTSIKDIKRDYSSVIQNLRMIKKPGENRWQKQDRIWSEAALGEDNKGNALFIFTRSPLSMYDFNEELLALKIGIVAVQHLEGGPEAQLYLNSQPMQLDLTGYSPFWGSNRDEESLKVPNVLGIKKKF